MAVIKLLNPTDLLEHQKISLFEELHPLTENAFEHHITPRNIWTNLFKANYLFYIQDGNQIEAYTTGQANQNKLHIYAVIVDPNNHTKGTGKALIRESLNRFPRQIISTQTQNPVLYLSLKSVAEDLGYDVFPHPRNELPLHILKQLQTEMPALETSLILRGLYGRQLRPTSLQMNKHFDIASLFDKLDLGAGDAYQVVCVKK
jgi:hypothetical protein